MSLFTKTVLSIALLVAVSGCAKKKLIKPDQTAQATPSPTAVPTLEPRASVEDRNSHYQVRAGDNLWSIASRNAVLGDPFRWPLLYRQNRDQIQDPDLIEIDQDLAYDPTPSAQEAADAVRKAWDTPPHVPHERPRKVLPLQY